MYTDVLCSWGLHEGIGASHPSCIKKSKTTNIWFHASSTLHPRMNHWKPKLSFFQNTSTISFWGFFFHSEDWAITSSVSSLSFSSEEISSSFSAPASETLYLSRTAAVKAWEWKTSGLEKWWMWYLAYPKSHSLAVAVSLKDAACVGHLF